MQKPVLIQGPMECETNVLLAELEDPKLEVINGYEYTSGQYDGIPVVVCQSHIGMANAVMSAVIGIERYNPEYVITQGTSGGHSPHVRRGDIVIGQKMVNIDTYQSAKLGPYEGTDARGYTMLDTEVYDGEAWGTTKVIYADEKLVEIAKAVEPDEGKTVIGCIGTGCEWNCEIDKIKFMHETWGTDAEEMENFAVAQVCLNYDIPYLPIRVISNSEITGEEFDEKTAENCQKYVIKIVKKAAMES